MSAFWASTVSSPINLVQGDPIRLKIRAKNAFGTGNYSDIVNSTVLVATIPEIPPNPPERDEAGTSSTQITVNMPEVLYGWASGYSAISSYNLEWN